MVHQEIPAGCTDRPRKVLSKWNRLVSLSKYITEWNWEWGQSHPNYRSQKFRMKLIRKREEMGSRNAWVQGRLGLPRRAVLMNLNLGGAMLMNLDFIL